MRSGALTFFAVLTLGGCGGSDSSMDPPVSFVFEDLLAALDIEGAVGVYESWDNIPDPDLAAKIREYAERNEAVIECDSRSCTGPEHVVAIRFREWSWTLSQDLPPEVASPPRSDHESWQESWQRSGDWFDPIIRDGGGVAIEIEWSDCLCGPIMAVEVTRTDEGRWQVGRTAQIGMVMS